MLLFTGEERVGEFGALLSELEPEAMVAWDRDLPDLDLERLASGWAQPWTEIRVTTWLRGEGPLTHHNAARLRELVEAHQSHRTGSDSPRIRFMVGITFNDTKLQPLRAEERQHRIGVHLAREGASIAVAWYLIDEHRWVHA